MKKYIPTILIAIVVSLISILGTYFVMSMNDDKDKVQDSNVVYNQNKDNNKLESGVKLLSTKEEGNKIVQTFEVTMNNKKQEFAINYEYDGNQEDDYYTLVGKYSNYEFYYIDADNYTKKEEIFNTDKIEEYFNIDNFRIIIGTDNKDYLGIITILGSGSSIKILYIFNDDKDLITKNMPAYGACETNDFMV